MRARYSPEIANFLDISVHNLPQNRTPASSRPANREPIWYFAEKIQIR